MSGLTAKVFRTYNASITLQQQLKELTNKSDNVAGKLLSYNRANRAVAILCNHQRAPPKTFEQSMANLQAKIDGTINGALQIVAACLKTTPESYLPIFAGIAPAILRRDGATLTLARIAQKYDWHILHKPTLTPAGLSLDILTTRQDKRCFGPPLRTCLRTPGWLNPGNGHRT
ncbi:hypothetical protein CRENBAI_004229 [Crenichthys baileyi]|uniref:DNA topoisomerase I eukaryotic-type domain-containing protein n=1 Tax=Crenichthys baileyi TaxID=28760 RepID=A0AAV9S8J3_9TELE